MLEISDGCKAQKYTTIFKFYLSVKNSLTPLPTAPARVCVFLSTQLVYKVV
jgi:hypothetical protein